MQDYRLDKTSPAIRSFILDYAKEKGIEVRINLTDQYYPFPIIYKGKLDACAEIHPATPIGLDEFLKKIDEIAAKPIVCSPLGGNKTEIEPNGDLKVGCTTIPKDQVKRFIKEYTIQPLPEKEFYVGGDFFIAEHKEIYMLVYSDARMVQLVALNGGNRYTNPISNHGAGVSKDLLLKLSGNRPMTHIKNPYQNG